MAQTLHEFTLGLLSDAPTRELFAADPTGVLQSAGLGDITAADVHDVLPLVLDMAPTHVVEAFEQTLGGAVPGLPVNGLPGADAIATLQHLTSALPVAVPSVPGLDDLGRELPVNALPVPGLDALPGLDSLPLPALDGLPVGSLPGLDSLPVGSLPGLDGLGRELPVNALPVNALPVDAVSGIVQNVAPGVPGLPNLSDPTALVGDLQGSLSDPARSLNQVQQVASQMVPVVAGHGGIPAVPSVDALVGKVTSVASDVDVTKTLDTTTHTVAGVAGNVPVAGKVVADASGHVTSAVHGVDVDGLSKTVTGLTSHIGGIGNVTTDPIHVVTGIANDPIHAVTNIADVSHTLDTVNSVHGDQALQHVTGAVDATVKDLNIGDDNHIGGIGNVDLGGVHVGDITHNLDATHLTGF
ncbi:IniB N-terminal domain-containing protein [Kutzneria chonburiensis]|uniref:IniB N-terminal domain-containing protein n=1 Tax=Kutzneria chonburiensis TaxID=1483604 RepID=A0ABV6MJT3_9PSEU|nr:IniB N-terminal domain-containing protein [Kutzneria chonburiensis]